LFAEWQDESISTVYLVYSTLLGEEEFLIMKATSC
jgi:hypothetical protein